MAAAGVACGRIVETASPEDGRRAVAAVGSSLGRFPCVPVSRHHETDHRGRGREKDLA
jgi:hypothetical protein